MHIRQMRTEPRRNVKCFMKLRGYPLVQVCFMLHLECSLHLLTCFLLPLASINRNQPLPKRSENCTANEVRKLKCTADTNNIVYTQCSFLLRIGHTATVDPAARMSSEDGTTLNQGLIDSPKDAADARPLGQEQWFKMATKAGIVTTQDSYNNSIVDYTRWE